MVDPIEEQDDVIENGFAIKAPASRYGGNESSDIEIVADAAINEKDVERQEIEEQIQAFLSKGGKIEHVSPNMLADPPKKPTSNYGGQPI